MTKDIIAFASLFLGLVVGPHEVEVVVSKQVGAVEILLDGERLAQLDGKPWRALCDLGDVLGSRKLEAVAFDRQGAELGRTEQWLNIPHPPAHAELLLDRSGDGQVIARVRSNSVVTEVPREVRAYFDGIEIPAVDPQAIPLPPHDSSQLHYLKVDLTFSDTLTSSVERTFGGSFSDEISSELTAIPLRIDKGVRPPLSSGWLQARGQDLDVIDVVSGPAELVVIRDQGAQKPLDRMMRRQWSTGRWVAPLKRGYSVQLVRPVAVLQRRDGFDLRLFSPKIVTPKVGGLAWMMTRVREGQVPPQLQRLSDAIAVSGVSASGRGRRRAVVLVLGPDPADSSQHPPASVTRYLAALRVPLIVWSTEGAIDTPWGPAADISSLAKLERETKQVVRRLEAQRIAWVEGVFQPPEVSLDPFVPGIYFAGS